MTGLWNFVTRRRVTALAQQCLVVRTATAVAVADAGVAGVVEQQQQVAAVLGFKGITITVLLAPPARVAVPMVPNLGMVPVGGGVAQVR